ncbi:MULTISPECIES: hypothetical protein [unclassified Xanthobacter]|uniref:hypothetical protein n=1 Tax=unclassified Xanthobacter TaxID=2623496 RepID=UPI001EDE98CB|nr:MULTISPECIES: hypothetical protein [unclassified Xanthobacter]
MARSPLLPTPLRAAATRAVVADRAPSATSDFKPEGKGGKVTYAGSRLVRATTGIRAGTVSRMPFVLGHLRGIAKGQLERQMEGFSGGGRRKRDAASGHWTAPKPRGSGSRFAQRA